MPGNRTVGDMADALFGENIWSTKKSEALKNAVIKEHNTDVYQSIEPMKKIASQLVFICRLFGTGKNEKNARDVASKILPTVACGSHQ